MYLIPFYIQYLDCYKHVERLYFISLYYTPYYDATIQNEQKVSLRMRVQKEIFTDAGVPFYE